MTAPAVRTNTSSAAMSYGAGSALPVLMLACGERYFSRQLLSLHIHSVMVQRVAGAIIVSTAIAMLLGWDVGWDIQIQLWLAPLFPSLLL